MILSLFLPVFTVKKNELISEINFFCHITSKGEVRIGGSAFRLYTIVILTSPVKHRSGLLTRASLRIRTDGLIIQNAHKKTVAIRIISARFRRNIYYRDILLPVLQKCNSVTKITNLYFLSHPLFEQFCIVAQILFNLFCGFCCLLILNRNHFWLFFRHIFFAV